MLFRSYSTEELGWAAKALASPHPAQLAILFSQSPAVRFSGLDFPSRHYLFSSLRLPNVFNVQDWAIYVRGLESLEDHSSTFFASSENAVGSHGTFLGNIGLSLGDTGGELRGPWEIFATLAYRHAW